MCSENPAHTLFAGTISPYASHLPWVLSAAAFSMENMPSLKKKEDFMLFKVFTEH